VIWPRFRETWPRGYFDVVRPENGRVRVIGWMFRLDRPFEEFELRVNGQAVARQPVQIFDRIGKAFHWIPHSGQSGFEFVFEPPSASGALEVVGRIRGRRAGRIRTRYRTDLSALGPPPSPSLMLRVTGSNEADYFYADGERTFSDIVAAAERRIPLERVRRLLDWGCGSGRLASHFLADGRVGEVYGVDIDGEAVDWCRRALPRGHFQKTEPHPPLPFPDRTFDLIVAYSVFTHLDRNLQKTWLAELKRILAPRGLLLATVHGEFAAQFVFPDRMPRTPKERRRIAFGLSSIIEGGIIDSIEDRALGGVAPEGYYRGVFQTRPYTLKEWSPILRVVEYREAAVGNYQDLVVLKRLDR
jgi:SAM-dependent methyltransferase